MTLGRVSLCVFMMLNLIAASSFGAIGTTEVAVDCAGFKFILAKKWFSEKDYDHLLFPELIHGQLVLTKRKIDSLDIRSITFSLTFEDYDELNGLAKYKDPNYWDNLGKPYGPPSDVIALTLHRKNLMLVTKGLGGRSSQFENECQIIEPGSIREEMAQGNARIKSRKKENKL